MNRKELACAAVGAVLGAAGCSPAMKSLAIPAANADEAASTSLPSVMKNVPHLVKLTLTWFPARNIGSVIFRLAPDKGWSIISSDPRLEVSIKRGSVAENVHAGRPKGEVLSDGNDIAYRWNGIFAALSHRRPAARPD